jgi:hypothetical protein
VKRKAERKEDDHADRAKAGCRVTVSKTMRALIDACLDDEHTLLTQRRFVSVRSAQTLDGMAKERGLFITELERLAAPAPPRPGGSWAAFLRETGRRVWETWAGHSAGGAIASCRQSRARTEAQYERALRSDLSEGERRVLAAQRGRLHDETHVLDRLQF